MDWKLEIGNPTPTVSRTAAPISPSPSVSQQGALSSDNAGLCSISDLARLRGAAPVARVEKVRVKISTIHKGARSAPIEYQRPNGSRRVSDLLLLQKQVLYISTRLPKTQSGHSGRYMGLCQPADIPSFLRAENASHGTVETSTSVTCRNVGVVVASHGSIISHATIDNVSMGDKLKIIMYASLHMSLKRRPRPHRCSRQCSSCIRGT